MYTLEYEKAHVEVYFIGIPLCLTELVPLPYQTLFILTNHAAVFVIQDFSVCAAVKLKCHGKINKTEACVISTV